MCLHGPSFVEMMMQRNRVASPTRFSPLLLQTLFKKPLLPQTKMQLYLQDEPEDLSLPESERRFRADFWNFIERKKRTGEIVLACSACLIVFSDPLLYRMHVSTHALGRSFQCVACGTVCSDRVAFQQHLVISRHG
ncbi:zinc finger, C2H2 type [Necator americanus]|uniref:Zinc finger, C2H2 type n=1 Tax=Necator americanus TaxID=51031 RepID=W2TE97_NECAM|nr:zinc finger, C2H2 type [Necator americanus]ETN80163.1 zinc finger, C2H2 type [Necator americanus]